MPDIVVAAELRRAFSDRIQAAAHDKMCQTVSPAAYVEPGKSQLHCLQLRTTHLAPERTALDYCFHVNSVTGNGVPVENREWFDFSCPGNATSPLDAISQRRLIADCFSDLMHASGAEVPVSNSSF